MVAIKDHPSFRQPANQNCKLWRYMNFTKYVSLLSSSSLYFNRSDQFIDPFEGRYGIFNINKRPDVYADFGETILADLARSTETFRKWTYISCWHANEYESAAMWDLYAKSNESIAVQTTYSKLKNTLPDSFFIGCVNYIDYETTWLPEGNALNPFMFKRKSFEHEHEVRALFLIQALMKRTRNMVSINL